jgi:hypothetical protein
MEMIIQLILRHIRARGMDLFGSGYRQLTGCEHGNKPSGPQNVGNFFNGWATVSLLGKNLLHGVRYLVTLVTTWFVVVYRLIYNIVNTLFEKLIHF